ncbi:Haloacid dehalogenase [Candidatus Magnetomoraceae bacterium gMMP-15]
MNKDHKIKVVLFDFGGVLAEEGFKAGLKVIAKKNSLNPEKFINIAFKKNYDLGFVSGRIREDGFWDAMREETGIHGSDKELTGEILSRFTLRPWMLKIVSDLKELDLRVGILSDQTHWLDQLNRKNNFFSHFDHVFNSYYLGITKKSPAIFDRLVKHMNVKPRNVLFIDDYKPHIKRAVNKGIKTILYKNKKEFLLKLATFIDIKK